MAREKITKNFFTLFNFFFFVVFARQQRVFSTFLRSFFPLDARVIAQYTSRWRIPPSTRNFSNSFHSRQAIKMRYICRGALRLDDEKALSKLFPWRHRRFKRMEIATRSGGFEDFVHFNCSFKICRHKHFQEFKVV